MRSAHLRAAAVSASHVMMAQFQKEVGSTFTQYLAAFDVLGRVHVIEAAKKKTGKKFKVATSTSARFTELAFERVPFTQAVNRLLGLVGMTRDAFDGLASRYQKQAFTIAGVSDVKLIDKIKNELSDVVESGGTIEDFRNAVNELTSDASVEQLAQTQIDTIFQTAVQSAYQGGRFEQMSDPAVAAALPYWVYRTAGDDRVRESHDVLDGFAALNDDPVWKKIFPPCGYNCRCTATAETSDDVPDDADTPGLSRLPDEAEDLPEFAEVA